MVNQKLVDLIHDYADKGYSISQIKKELTRKYSAHDIKEAIHYSYQRTAHISVLSIPLLLLLIGIPIVLFFIFKLATVPETTNTIFFSLLVIYPAIISAFLGYHCAKHHISEKESLKYELLLGFITGLLIFILFITYAPQEIADATLYFVISIVVSLFIAVFFTLLFRLSFHEKILPLHEHQPMMNYKNPFDLAKFFRLGGDIYMILFIVVLIFLGYSAGATYTALIFLVGFFIFNYLVDLSYKHHNDLLAILAFVTLFIFSGYLSYWLLLLVGFAFLKAMVYFYKTDKNHNFFALFNCWTIIATFFALLLFAILLFTSYVIFPFFGHMSVMYLIIIYFIVLMITFPFVIRIGASLLGRITGKINFFAAFYPLTMLVKPRRHINRDPIRYGIFLGFWLMMIVLVIVGISGTVFVSNTYERNLNIKSEIIASIDPLMIEAQLQKRTWIHPIPETVLPSIFLSLQTQYESQLQSYKNYYIPRVTGFEAFFSFISGRFYDDMVENVHRIIRLGMRTKMIQDQAEVVVDEFAAINANNFMDGTRDLQEHVTKMRFTSEQLYGTVSLTFGLEKQEGFVPFEEFAFYPGTLLGESFNDFMKHSNLALAMTEIRNLNFKIRKELGNEYFITELRKPSEIPLTLEDEALKLKLLLHYLGREYLEGCEAYDMECYSKLTLFVADINVCRAAELPAKCEEAFEIAFPQYSRCPDNTIINKELKKCN